MPCLDRPQAIASFIRQALYFPASYLGIRDQGKQLAQHNLQCNIIHQEV